MKVIQVPMDVFAANCYLAASETGRCAVIDPGAQGEKILEWIKQNGLTPVRILLTHGHFDHIGAVNAIRASYPDVTVTCGEKEKTLLESPGMNLSRFQPGEPGQYDVKADELVSEGDEICLDELTFTVKETPGHTRGSVCYRCGEALFTGDTLFDNSYGRTDFPTGDDLDMLRSLKRLMMETEGNPTVYPGHETTCTMDSARLFLRRLIRGEMMNL